MGDGAVPDVMDEDTGRLPVAAEDVDDFKMEMVDVEPEALDAAGLLRAEQHRLAVLQPELAIFRALGSGEVVEHVLVVDDAVLEDLDEGRTLVGISGLEHIRQVPGDIEAARDETRPAAEREGGRLGGMVDRARRGRRGLRAFAAGWRILALVRP